MDHEFQIISDCTLEQRLKSVFIEQLSGDPATTLGSAKGRSHKKPDEFPADWAKCRPLGKVPPIGQSVCPLGKVLAQWANCHPLGELSPIGQSHTKKLITQLLSTSNINNVNSYRQRSFLRRPWARGLYSQTATECQLHQKWRAVQIVFRITTSSYESLWFMKLCMFACYNSF